MTIDVDVRVAARHFGLDPKLVQAVVNAEGNILKAVQCSFPDTKTRAEALDILCRSAVHAMSDYLQQDSSEQSAFVQFWSARWAPRGAGNDPKDLNQFWPVNVLRLWRSV